MTFSEELSGLLKDELLALEKLLKISEDKTESIVENKVEALDEVISIEEELIKTVITLEKHRMELLDNWGVPMDTPISDVLNKVEDGRERLSLLREELAIVMNKLDERNKLNNSIMQENLDWLEFNINLITSTQAPISYDGDKKDKSTGDSSIFDTKA